MGNGDTIDIDLESEEFRIALLKQMNGQSEGMQTLIRLVDTRFQSHARRFREHRQDHSEERKKLGRWGLAAVAAVPTITLTLLKAWEALA